MAQHLHSARVPTSTSPIAQGTCAGGLVFVGGQMPVELATGDIPAEAAAQVELTIQHCLHVLAEAGGVASDVTLVFVYLTDLSIKPLVNEAFLRHFGPVGPARNLIEVSNIGEEAIVEMSLIASVKLAT